VLANGQFAAGQQPRVTFPLPVSITEALNSEAIHVDGISVKSAEKGKNDPFTCVNCVK
jgi:hypothetical protein